MAEIPLAEQIKELERMVALRAKTSAAANAFLSDVFHADLLAEVKSKVDRENAALEAALETLRGLSRRTAWLAGHSVGLMNREKSDGSTANSGD